MEPNVNIRSELAPSDEGDAIAAGDAVVGPLVPVEVAPFDLPAPGRQPASVLEPVASDYVLLGEDILTPGNDLEAMPNTDDLLVDVLAESLLTGVL